MAVTKLRLAILDTGCPGYVIADAARLYPTRLSEYANGRKHIPSHHLSALSHVLDKQPEELTGWAMEDEPRLQL